MAPTAQTPRLGSMGQVLSIVVAVLAFVLIYTYGVKMMASFSKMQPEPPTDGELRKVKITYRCSLCGTEVKMTKAPLADPEPPRCCMEDMDVIEKADV